MLFVNYKINAAREDIMSVMRDSNLVVSEEKLETPKGKPMITLKEKGNRIKMKCTMIGGASRDNGFIQGTTFRGSVKEKNGVSRVRGIIITEPVYHLIVIAIIAVLIYRCIRLGGFNPVPIILAVFSIFMLKDEFKKQAVIKRYIFRSLKIVYATNNYKVK